MNEKGNADYNDYCSSNFERLLWLIAYDIYGSGAEDTVRKRQAASEKVKQWQADLKTKGGFSVEAEMLDAARVDFMTERVSDEETVETIRDVYGWPGSQSRILDPHTAIGVRAALRSARATPAVHNVALATAHPAKFSNAVEMALEKEKDFRFQTILPEEFVGLERLEKRNEYVRKSHGLDDVRRIILERVQRQPEINGTDS